MKVECKYLEEFVTTHKCKNVEKVKATSIRMNKVIKCWGIKLVKNSMALKKTVFILYGVILVVIGSINQLHKNLVISIILVLSIIVFFVVLIWILVQFKLRKASENL